MFLIDTICKYVIITNANAAVSMQFTLFLWYIGRGCYGLKKKTHSSRLFESHNTLSIIEVAKPVELSLVMILLKLFRYVYN